MTLQRVCLCVWLLTSLACSDGKAAPLKRPSPTEDPAAAVVLHVVGAVTVTPERGAPFPATPEQDLVKTDLLTPAEGAFVVVGLTNGHLVRIDDVGALKVGQILLFGAPTASLSIDRQLKALLDPGETAPATLVAERAAAWRHMTRAAETTLGSRVKSQIGRDEPQAPSEEEAASPSPVVAADGAGPRSRDVSGRPPPAPSKSAPAAKKKLTAPAPAAPDADVADSATPPHEPGVTGSFGAKPDATTPMQTVPFLDGALGGCLIETASIHGLDADEIALLIEVKGGFVRRVRVRGGVPTPDCASPLAGRAVKVSDGWLVLRLLP